MDERSKVSEAKDRPNILIILTDQLRYDCLGAYGNHDVQTPVLDSLATDGIMYRNCFCTFPVCTPSRYSLLTGLYGHQHLGVNNHGTIPSGIDTFPRIAQNSGYTTKAVGKMHFTPTYLDVGFEHMILAEQDGPGRYDDDYHRYLQKKGLVDRIDLIDQVNEYRNKAPEEYWRSFGAIESNLKEEHYSTTWIADRAVEAIDEWDGGANLLMVGFIKPHHPFDPPAPWSQMYNPEKLSLLPGWTESCLPSDLARKKGYFSNEELTEAKLKKLMAYYYASISQIDHHVGRMIHLLNKKGLYDDTLIVFTSDHGEYMGYHHLLLKQNFMYEPLVRVPLLIKYPGQVKGGTVSDDLVSTIDVTPTILTQVGRERGVKMNGQDLSKDSTPRDFIFAQSTILELEDNREYMVRSRDYKLLLCENDNDSRFFDLINDPFELNNLYKDPRYREVVEEYKRSLTNWILFEAAAKAHLHENALIISADNVLEVQGNHRQESAEYFRRLMQD